jgi:hypothetical protein
MRNRDNNWNWDFNKYENPPATKYEAAQRKVKTLKDFYSHLLVYVVVNIFIVGVNVYDLEPGESYFQVENFFTLFFWGIGLVAHGLSVFGSLYFFNSNWQERKIKEFMEKEEQRKWE